MNRKGEEDKEREVISVKVEGYFVIDVPDEENENIALGRGKQKVIDQLGEAFTITEVSIERDQTVQTDF